MSQITIVKPEIVAKQQLRKFLQTPREITYNNEIFENCIFKLLDVTFSNCDFKNCFFEKQLYTHFFSCTFDKYCEGQKEGKGISHL